MKKLFALIQGVFLSVKTTIFLLITIALVSIIGTLIPQQKEAAQYIAQYGLLLYRLFDLLGFLDLYASWWFRLLLVMLLINLVTCSIKRLPRITSRGGFTMREWLGRLGPHITHLSLVLILIGSLIGNLWGFKGFVNIPQGDEANAIFLKGTEKMLGLDFTIRCEKFEMSYYPESEVPREYLSDLVILEAGREVLRKRIRVNDPLQYKGITFYQSSYGFLPSRPEERKAEMEIIPKGKNPKAFRIQLGEGETKQVQGTDIKVELATLIPDFFFGEGNRILSRSDQPNNPAVGVNIYQNGKLSYSGWSFLKHPDFHGSKDDTYRVIFLQYSGGEKPYTGLMVVKDPGIPFVYGGFVALVFGLICSFFLRRRSTQKGGEDA